MISAGPTTVGDAGAGLPGSLEVPEGDEGDAGLDRPGHSCSVSITAPGVFAGHGLFSIRLVSKLDDRLWVFLFKLHQNNT